MKYSKERAMLTASIGILGDKATQCTLISRYIRDLIEVYGLVESGDIDPEDIGHDHMDKAYSNSIEKTCSIAGCTEEDIVKEAYKDMEDR